MLLHFCTAAILNKQILIKSNQNLSCTVNEWLTDLHIGRSTFISYQQQVTLTINHYLFLEPSTCIVIIIIIGFNINQKFT